MGEAKMSYWYFKYLFFVTLNPNQFILVKKLSMYDTIDTKLLKNFQIIKKIGQGAYGQVWKAKNKKTASICALKKIFDAFRNPNQAQKTYREIKYLEKMDHPNIIKLLAYHKPTNQKQIYLELQYMEADLSTALRNSVLKEIHKHYIFYQMANALHYLHSAQLVHRDIKPTNILINQTCQAKICDFGLIRSLKKDNPNQQIVLTQNVATRWYRAPQVLLCNNNYGKAVDIWSLGCVLAEVLLHKPLFQGTSTISQLQKIFQVIGKPSEADLIEMKNEGAIKVIKMIEVKQRKSLISILNIEDSNLLDLLQRIFQFNPSKRPTAEQILKHPFSSKFRGRIQQKKSLHPLRVMYQSRLLSVKDYKSLLLESEEKEILVEAKNKGKQDLTFDQNLKAIYKSMPTEASRNNFINNVPSEKVETKSTMNSTNLNKKNFSPFGLKPKKQVIPIKETIKEENFDKKSFSPSFLQKKKNQNSSPNVTPQKIHNPNVKVKKMLTFPLKLSANKSTSPLKPNDDKSKEKFETIKKSNAGVINDFQARFTQGCMTKILPKQNNNNFNPLNTTTTQGEARVTFENQKKKIVTETEINKSVFQLTSSKSALLNEDMKRNVTPTRSISPFNNKNVPLPQGSMNNRNFMFKTNPLNTKIPEQAIKKYFPVTPYELKK